jgi:hypothetical protein
MTCLPPSESMKVHVLLTFCSSWPRHLVIDRIYLRY